MDHRNAELAALIGSRICHDLISPIGAITNGLELLDLTGAAKGPELDLIADSVGNAGARIKFFRIAFGAAGDQSLGRSEIVSILDDLGRGGRMQVTWAVSEDQSRAEVRLAFLALLCCESALPHGGTIMVTRAGETWRVAASSYRLSLDPDLWQHLSAPCPSRRITPAQVQFALLPAVAGDMGRQVSVTAAGTEVAVTF